MRIFFLTTLRCRGFSSPATKVLSISNAMHGLCLPAFRTTSMGPGTGGEGSTPGRPRQGRKGRVLAVPGLGSWGHHRESGSPDQGLIWELLLICEFPRRHKHVCTRFLKKFRIQKRISNKSLSASVSGGKFFSVFTLPHIAQPGPQVTATQGSNPYVLVQQPTPHSLEELLLTVRFAASGHWVP